MKTYKLANNIIGWVIFAIAAIVYLLTIEPSASFWDCGEFISSAYKLEVGHPPGNPIFMLMANLFTQLASEPSQVASMVNSMSAIFSALTILFLFWTITHLARRIIIADDQKQIKLSQTIAIIGAGAVGALAYTFSDTFWFSAVEGEVYAFSSLMTGLVFWLILKWEDVANEPHSDRWLILIAYLMGVSIAVHLLNLLCIPAIVLVYYFRKYPHPTLKGALLALLVSFGIIAAILYGLVQGIMEVCGWFELLFVNTFKLPYNTGVAFYVIVIFGVLSWGIWETMRTDKNPLRAKISFILSVFLLGIPFLGSNYILGILLTVALTAFLFLYKKINLIALNTILISLLVITIGYSSYALILIRSSANTPMDQNSPEDIFTLRTYLSREQYGETPLFYGPTFVSEVKYEAKGNTMVAASKDNGPVWTQIAKRDSTEKDKYFVSKRKESYVYVDELNTLFPRMYSQDERHTQAYKEWTNFKGTRVRVTTPQGTKTVIKPTFGENLKFFFNYQVNFMYWRYFLWNFSGRQNDIQGYGGISNGNWITGIRFIDENLVGPQDNMPDSIAKNKGHNTYYLLPLLLGVLGLFFQVYAGKRGTEQFWITFLLFFMTGLAIVVYLNQTPYQPRERDYAYAGSFYAFCIWIGLGTLGIIKGLNKFLKIPAGAASVCGAILSL
jgi:MFS family permease